MIDNLSNCSADIIGCHVDDVVIEGDKTIRGLVVDSSSGEVIIRDIDTQGSLEIMQSHGDFLMISVYGYIPEIKYEYYAGDDPVGEMISISPKGGLFTEFKFKPVDDSTTGEVYSLAPTAVFAGRSLMDVSSPDTRKKVYTFMMSLIKSTVDTKEFEGEQLHMMCFSGGIRHMLSTSRVSDVAYGSLRKQLRLLLTEDTALLSVSTGNIQFSNPEGSADYMEKPEHFQSILDKETHPEYKAAYTRIKKMLEHPNKLFNTEGTI